jgi:hypothetical protein
MWDPKNLGSTAQSDSAESSALARAGLPAAQVTGSQVKYRAEFYTTTHPDFDIALGPGASVAAPQTTSPALNLVTGTAAGTSSITGKKSFGPPFNAGFGFRISQKIANQEFYFELVAENADGTLDENCVAAWRIAFSDSSNVAQAKFEVRNGGPTGRWQSAVQGVVSSIATDVLFEITVESDETWFHTKAINNPGARSSSFNTNLVSVDPNRRYRPRLRTVNTATAASSTTVVFYYLSVVDYTEIQTYVQSGSGGTQPGTGIPVNITGTPGVSLSSTAISASSTVTGVNNTRVVSAATTNEAAIKGSSARVYGWSLANTSAAWRYVKLYNQVAVPTPGAGALIIVIAIPPGGKSEVILPVPSSLGTGLGITIVSGSADTDATAVAAGDVVGTLFWV